MNKYNFQIKLNNTRKLEDFKGNGIYKDFVEGCFSNNSFFRCYPIENVFYLAVGDNPKELLEVDKEPVDNEDFITYARLAKVFMKYVNILVDRHLEKLEEGITIRSI